MQSQKSIFYGFNAIINSVSFIYKGLDYIKAHPSIQQKIILAVIINILSFIISIFLIWGLLAGIANFTINTIFTSNLFLQLFIGFISFILAVWIGLIFYGILNSIVNAPIYSQIADYVMKEKNGLNYNEFEQKWYQSVYQTTILEAGKLLISLGFLVVGLALNLIPILGPVLLFITFFIQIIILSGLDLLEPIFASKNKNLLEMVVSLKNKPFTYWPFLTISGIVCSIPVINTVCIPIFIVSALLLYSQNPLIESEQQA